MSDDIAALYLRDVTERFRAHRKLGEKAIAQVYDSGLTARLDPESNSIAILVKHLAGNMRSRWTGFLTSDGEKPDRNRDGEFELAKAPGRAELLEWWDDGWERLFETLATLRPEDLTRTITIRGLQYTVLEAINAQVAHYAYHVGQIVQLARHLAGPAWKSLSIPRKPTG
ncbi:MAG: DinB family protein [Gemmatimonadota bacterium]